MSGARLCDHGLRKDGPVHRSLRKACEDGGLEPVELVLHFDKFATDEIEEMIETCLNLESFHCLHLWRSLEIPNIVVFALDDQSSDRLSSTVISCHRL